MGLLQIELCSIVRNWRAVACGGCGIITKISFASALLLNGALPSVIFFY